MAATIAQLLSLMAQAPSSDAASSAAGGDPWLTDLMAQVLSRSFLHFGGEVRPISRSLRQAMMSVTEPEFDMAGLANLENKQLDQLVWIFYRIRPDTKLAALGLTSQTAGTAIRVMKQARARCQRQFGEGMLGITSNYSNIDEIAVQHGWEESWYLAKPEPKRKAKPTAMARSRSRSRGARSSGMRALTWEEPEVVSRPDATPVIPDVPSITGNSMGIPSLHVPSPTLIGHSLPPWSFCTEQGMWALFHEDKPNCFIQLPSRVASISFYLVHGQYTVPVQYYQTIFNV